MGRESESSARPDLRQQRVRVIEATAVVQRLTYKVNVADASPPGSPNRAAGRAT